jgi:hypothetical protein
VRPDHASLVPWPRVLLPLGLAVVAQPVAYALLARPGALDPTGWYGRPGLLLAVHLLTVGVLVLPIAGAGAQMVPVVTARPPSPLSSAVDRGVVLALAVSAPLLWAGLAGRWQLGLAGAIGVIAALLVRSVAVVARLARASGRRVTRGWLLAAEISLWIGLAAALQLYLSRSGLPAGSFDPIARVGDHARLLIGGWAGGWILGLSALLLPMFTVAHEPRPLPYALAGLLWFSGVWSASPALWAAGAALAAFELAHSLLGAHRKLGAGVSLVAASLAGLLVTAALAVSGAPGFAVVASALGLWLLPAQQGYAQRIAPFLAWSHAFAGDPHAPPARSLSPERLGWASGGLGVAGGALVVAAALTDGSFGTAGAALLLVASFLQASFAVATAFFTWRARLRAGAIWGMEAR